MGWPNKKADYFTADGYIRTQRAFKFGITWPFWILPGTNKSTGMSSGSASGGNRGGSSLPDGLSAGGGRQSAKNMR